MLVTIYININSEKSSVFIIIYSVNGSNILYFSELMFMYIVTSIHA